MNRVLLVDDRREFEIEKVAPLREQLRALAEELHDPEFGGDIGIVSHPENAAEVVWLNRHDYDLDSLNEAISQRAGEAWDVVAIDINLFGKNDLAESELRVPARLLSTFRAINKTAIAILYSGAISDYLRRLIDIGVDKQGKPAERLVREIFDQQIAHFVASDHLVNTILNVLQRPPLALRIQKELLRTPNVLLDLDAIPQPLGGKTFMEIASNLRRGNKDADSFLALLVSRGVAAIADLYA